MFGKAKLSADLFLRKIDKNVFVPFLTIGRIFGIIKFNQTIDIINPNKWVNAKNIPEKLKTGISSNPRLYQILILSFNPIHHSLQKVQSFPGGGGLPLVLIEQGFF